MVEKLYYIPNKKCEDDTDISLEHVFVNKSKWEKK